MKGSGVLSVGARLSKLRAMTSAEIAHRLWYTAALARERRQHRTGTLSRPGRLPNGLVSSLRAEPDWRRRVLASRGSAPLRFLPSVNERSALQQLFHTRYPAELAATSLHAAAARAHRFSFFGAEYQYGPDIPWQSDPVTGAAWPPVFHADVPVHGGDAGFGDVKHVWELSRQQFLIDLGKSWFLSGSREDVEALQVLVRSWIAGNPYATGVNWACALEPAFRVFSWLWAYHLTVDGLDDDFHLEWLGSFADHAAFIERHLEQYSSPYNHLIAEAAALYMVGACFPEFAAAPRWRSVGKQVMARRLGEQFYPDGGSVEQSTFYHHATVGFYLLAGLTARSTGDELPQSIWTAIERGLEFSMSLAQPDGSTPSIGGADDGKPIRMEHLPFWDFTPYLSVGAVVFARGDFKAVAGRFHEDALWLTGTSGLQTFERLSAEAPRATSVALPSSGYFVLRSDWSRSADYVCVDCGEQAAGMRTDAVPNSMHGHADCLSIVVWLGGTRTLIDSGLYAYNCGGEWEAHFRETAAHSTARVDGRDQARHIRKMAWSHSYRAQLEGWSPGEHGGWVVGSHDGYARGPEGVRHRRAVWLRAGGYLVVKDEFESSGTHDFEVNYQFAPGAVQMLDEGRARYDDSVGMAWMGTEAWEVRSTCGGSAPSDGWIAPSLGIKVPAPRLTFTCRTGASRLSLVSVFASDGDARSRIHTMRTATGEGLLGVAVPGGVDVIAHAGSPAGGLIETDATLVICRLRVSTSATVDVERIGGTGAVVDTEALRRVASEQGWLLETPR